MAVRTFAAIDVGSYELTMKIFEISPKAGLKEIDCISHRIELGTDTYNTGKISNERVDELCEVLREFKQIMEGYRVDAYKAYGTSAIREMENTLIVLDMIAGRTGLKIDVISNSEQRFLDYKAIASKGEGFRKIIEKGTVIVDIGGGSIQISLFDKDSLVTTQNIRLGVLRMRDRILSMSVKPSDFERLIEEMVDNQLEILKKMYFKDRIISNIIVVDDYLSTVMQEPAICGERKGFMTSRQCYDFVETIRGKSRQEIALLLGIGEEEAFLLFNSAVLMKRILQMLGADLLWAPGVTLCDGIVYEYAEVHRLIKPEHDFEKDILACASTISKRYMGSRKRSESMENIALTIFDSMKKVHGLKSRHRLLLQLAAKLYDCGKYISMANVGECSYNIIMATEIIGLSHQEREMVANIVKYNKLDFGYYSELSKTSELDVPAYLTVAKLTAILKLANGLDRSHKMKFKTIKAVLKEKELILTVDESVNLTLEKGLIGKKAQFFEEVYSLRPVIRQKNMARKSKTPQ